MANDYIFKVKTDGDILDLEGRVIGHINLDYIKSLAEGQQGEWKVNGCLIACNKCGRILLKASELYNFCPNCGVKMRGVK